MTTTMEATKTNLGRMAALGREDGMGRVLYGNVLDLVAGKERPKRVRIQFGNPELKGAVVNLLDREYRFLWWADEEED